MTKAALIFLAGASGLVGSAILRHLRQEGFRRILSPRRAELDLLDRAAVFRFLDEARPEVVFLAAAKVGGIVANNTYPADFLFQNLAIQSNVIEGSLLSGVRRLLFLGSNCIYPKFASQPIEERDLLSGHLEPTNRPYAVAKIAGVEMCWAANRQHGTRYLAAMPVNMYGPGDHYDLQNCHVLPALLRKAHEAKIRGLQELVVWGTGTPRREFLYSGDLAAACLRLVELTDVEFDSSIKSESIAPIVNVGPGLDIPIAQLAEVIADVVGFAGTLAFDSSKPDGTPRKLLSNTRITSLGWRPTVSLRDGLARTYEDFLARF